MRYLSVQLGKVLHIIKNICPMISIYLSDNMEVFVCSAQKSITYYENICLVICICLILWMYLSVQVRKVLHIFKICKEQTSEFRGPDGLSW